ncbi:MAG: TIGR03032 family protein [Pseudomonadota bacterium]
MRLTARFSPGVPQLLDELAVSLMVTTYQAGKVILLSAAGERLVQLLRDFDRPMGIATNGDLLALALRLNVSIFRNDRELARTYPKNPDTYDAMYFPIAINKTDFIDTHDLFFTNSGLVAVNTAYSCLVKVDGTFSFQPIWKPTFISDYRDADYCHLNGMSVDADGEVSFVTAFGETSTPSGWRTNKLLGGVVIDVRSGETVCGELAMPHSPRIYRNKLYVLASGTEELLQVDPKTGQKETVARLDGFIRGLSFAGDYAFVGSSKLRKSHAFGDLGIANKRIRAGVSVVNIVSGEVVGSIEYGDELDEVYDVHVLPEKQRPNILNLPMSEQFRAMVTPHGARWVLPEDPGPKSNSKIADEVRANESA